MTFENGNEAKQYRIYIAGEIYGYVFLTDEELKLARQKVKEQGIDFAYELVTDEQ